ncbi:hypothetical protein WCX49_11780 [Sulfurimonas sp. HSL-1656]|uniref:hypothetical protein n=1 Tax=Thiomicrolovo subterrani TaxID=3131934 RepID=UPI0031F99C4E
MNGLTNFDFIVEAMPFEDETEKIVWAAMFCRNLAGCTITIPAKMQEREIAKLMFKKGVDFDVVETAVSLKHRTLRNIQKEVLQDDE